MMSQKEAKRAQVMEHLTAGQIDQKQAGKLLAVSVRQIKRIVKRYRTEGLPGLVSKKRGVPSNRRLSDGTKQQAIDLIGTHYHDFGPTLACEKLAERHGLDLSVKSIRQLIGRRRQPDADFNRLQHPGKCVCLVQLRKRPDQ